MLLPMIIRGDRSAPVPNWFSARAIEGLMALLTRREAQGPERTNGSRCVSSVAKFAITAAADATFVWSGLVKSGQLAVAGWRSGSAYFNSARLGQVNVSTTSARATAWQSTTLGAGRAAANFGGTASVYYGVDGGFSSPLRHESGDWRDLIPVAATWQAWGSALDACP